jgi:hypothetical protein
MFIGPTRKNHRRSEGATMYIQRFHYKYIALRWNTISLGPASYKHDAPPEHRQVSQVCHCHFNGFQK